MVTPLYMPGRSRKSPVDFGVLMFVVVVNSELTHETCRLFVVGIVIMNSAWWGLVRYCNTKTSRNGVNNMWILKNSTSLLSSLDQLYVRTATSVQTFDFSTLMLLLNRKDSIHRAAVFWYLQANFTYKTNVIWFREGWVVYVPN